MSRRAALALACLLGTPTPSLGATCTQDAVSCGRSAFKAGVEAYEAERYTEAIEHFRQAQTARPHPVVLFNLALAEARGGKLRDAIRHLDEVMADPQTSQEVRAKAERERARADGRLARIEVDASGKVELLVDGVLVAGSPPVAALDPGSYDVRVRLDGRTVIERRVDLSEAERLRLTVERQREIVVAPGDSVAAPSSPSSAGLSPTWFYVGASVTAVLGGVATWSALDTKRAFDDYERDLPRLDQAAVNARVSDGHARERRTNWLLSGTAVAGAATAALGVFWVDWGGRGTRQGVVVGPGSAYAMGTF